MDSHVFPVVFTSRGAISLRNMANSGVLGQPGQHAALVKIEAELDAVREDT